MLNIYISPNGDGDGTSVSAPTSLSNALQINRDNSTKQDITFKFIGGTYYLPNTLQLSAADSARPGCINTWENYNETPVVLTGAQTVTGWTLYDAGRNIWRIQAPGTSIVRQFYMNGVRRLRIRKTTGLSGFSCTTTVNETTYRISSFPTIAKVKGMEFVFNGLGTVTWVQSRLTVASLTQGTTKVFNMHSAGRLWNQIGVAMNQNFRYWPQQPTWIENALEFLDTTTKGAFYFDEDTRYIYYVPVDGENLNTVETRVPLIETLIEANSLANTTFKGINFQGTSWEIGGYFLDSGNNMHWKEGEPIGNMWGTSDQINIPKCGLVFKNTKNIALVNITLCKLGGAGILARNSSHFNVISSTLTDIAATGMYLAEAGIETIPYETSSHHMKVLGCDVYDIACEYQSGTAIGMFRTNDSKIMYNYVRNIPYAGIILGGAPVVPGQGIEIAYNKVHTFMQVIKDGGGIYSSSMVATADNPNTIHHNHLYDYPVHWGCVALYTDYGTQYTKIFSNVVEGIEGNYWLMMNGQAGAANNEVTDNFYSQWMLKGDTDELFSRTVMTNNVVLTTPHQAGALAIEAGTAVSNMPATSRSSVLGEDMSISQSGYFYVSVSNGDSVVEFPSPANNIEHHVVVVPGYNNITVRYNSAAGVYSETFLLVSPYFGDCLFSEMVLSGVAIGQDYIQIEHIAETYGQIYAATIFTPEGEDNWQQTIPVLAPGVNTFNITAWKNAQPTVLTVTYTHTEETQATELLKVSLYVGTPDGPIRIPLRFNSGNGIKEYIAYLAVPTA